MQKLKSFKDLRVWQKAYELAFRSYKMTESYPKQEMYGLVNQIRRSAVSVVSNIAEGYARRNKKEYIQFLSIAYSSLSELETQMLLSKDLKFCSTDDHLKLDSLRDEIGGMLYTLIQKLKAIPRTLNPVP